ncbi:hypothetical protein [Microbacterium terricola]|uniref:Uncharacterized protein n=1 Tax=Microbacterium terricola TaxID=344163 RepID=A0ABM8DYU8_9MICO|nr:hypothetical protein [Microbacterium terricola]UYK41441.1 hypothetical protein OAU46_07385 [Microbacterium terricola]BDV30769.1 hypothetical protein Microterr_14290 [Microbacterium terricola]
MNSMPEPAAAAHPRTPSPLSAPLRHLYVLAFSAMGLIALAAVLAIAVGGVCDAGSEGWIAFAEGDDEVSAVGSCYGDVSTKIDLMVWAAVTFTAGVTCAVGAVALAGVDEVARRLEQSRRG